MWKIVSLEGKIDWSTVCSARGGHPEQSFSNMSGAGAITIMELLLKQMQDLTQQNTSLKQQLKQRKHLNAELMQKNTGLEQQNAELEQQNAELMQRNTGLEQQNAALKEGLVDLLQDCALNHY